MTSIIVSALIAMLGKIVTSEFVEFTIIKFAEILVKRTETEYDDEFLAEIKALLGRK